MTGSLAAAACSRKQQDGWHQLHHLPTGGEPDPRHGSPGAFYNLEGQLAVTGDTTFTDAADAGIGL